MCSGRQSRPHLFHVVRKVCTKSGHVSTIPPVVKNNSHHGISTIKSDYPAETRIDNHDKEIEALKKKCGQLGEEISKLKEWRAYMMGGIGVCMFLGPLVLKWLKIL